MMNAFFNTQKSAYFVTYTVYHVPKQISQFFWAPRLPSLWNNVYIANRARARLVPHSKVNYWYSIPSSIIAAMIIQVSAWLTVTSDCCLQRSVLVTFTYSAHLWWLVCIPTRGVSQYLSPVSPIYNYTL